MAELLENVLSQLPVETILYTAQRVSKQWQKCVKESPLFRRRCFLDAEFSKEEDQNFEVCTEQTRMLQAARKQRVLPRGVDVLSFLIYLRLRNQIPLVMPSSTEIRTPREVFRCDNLHPILARPSTPNSLQIALNLFSYLNDPEPYLGYGDYIVFDLGNTGELD
ncbi:hypothetical protein BCR34DRAFT_607353 [Clohesyomyces aquaticus]|uniref:F-box domain-containing protein n=1 Tax=Clohesyomyces aquaticus TaxID=1231657 RepID=A0A1Y1YHY4_9PLEO|nr:hypothetical protein BCR34DRAFT_607353 [Clohesyomyces aquaticus]